MTQLVDSHCHLDLPELSGDVDGVIARARAAGVIRMVTICNSLTEWPGVLEIASAHHDVYCTVGVHPHEAGRPEERVNADELVRLATSSPKVVGIGESGLDYFYDHAPRAEQQRNFREHIRAASLTDLPLVIHTRDAEDDTMAILREEMAGFEKPLRAVLHCFSSARYLAEAALSWGFYISLSGMLTFNKSEELRAIARDVPMDRLLVETDSPFLAPVPHRGKPCEPAYVVHTARKLAEVKNVGMDEIARATTDNFFSLFNRVPR